MPTILRNDRSLFKQYFGQVGQMLEFCTASNSSPFLFCRRCSECLFISPECNNLPEVSVASWGTLSPSKAFRGNLWQPQPASQAGLIRRPEFSTCPSFLQKQDQQLLTPNGLFMIINRTHFCGSLGQAYLAPIPSGQAHFSAKAPQEWGW